METNPQAYGAPIVFVWLPLNWKDCRKVEAQETVLYETDQWTQETDKTGSEWTQERSEIGVLTKTQNGKHLWKEEEKVEEERREGKKSGMEKRKGEGGIQRTIKHSKVKNNRNHNSGLVKKKGIFKL